MKIIELFEESINVYVRRLMRDLKIKRLGSGAFGQVFQHPAYSNVVVKIFLSYDEAYSRYLKFALANQDNPYVPKIIGVHDYESPTTPHDNTSRYYQIVFMEKYEKYNQAKMDKWFQQIKPFLGASKKSILKVEIGADFDKADWKRLSVQSTRPMLAAFATWIVANYRDADLHDGNIMFNGDHPVFTDPVA